MKRILAHKTIYKTLLFLFIFASFHAKSTPKATLKISIFDCRNVAKSAYLSELKILKNGTPFKTLTPRFENKQVLNNLEVGSYALIYISIFGKEEQLTVEISESKKYETTLCTNMINHSKETYQPVINRLEENEYYTIITLSQGCFHSTADSLMLKRDHNGYTITWKEKSKQLSATDLETIKHFEIELNYIKGGGCTTGRYLPYSLRRRGYSSNF